MNRYKNPESLSLYELVSYQQLLMDNNLDPTKAHKWLRSRGFNPSVVETAIENWGRIRKEKRGAQSGGISFNT